jgi:hypothetical protein
MLNKKYHIHINATTDEEVKEELIELAYIMTGLRESTKKWKEHYGADNRNTMQRWEEKADAWINKHKVIIND